MSFDKNDLTTGPVWRGLLKFFFPIAAGTLVQQMYNTADALIVGKWCGTGALAAAGGSPAQIINLIVGVCVALTAGASVVVAHFYGEKNYEGIKTATATSLIASFVIGMVVTIVGYAITPWLLDIMKTPKDTIELSIIYLRCLFGGSLFVMLYNMGAGILRAAGDSKRPFIYLCICSVANVILDLIAVAVFDLGILGAGLATAASQIISCVMVLVRIFKSNEAYRISFSDLHIDKKNLRRMTYMGVPSGLSQLMYSAANSVIMVGVNELGTNFVAAWTVTNKVDGFYWAAMVAAGSAVLSFTGQNYGAGKIDRVKKCAKDSLILFIGLTVVFMSILTIVVPIVTPYFDSNPKVAEIVNNIFWIFVYFYPIWPVIEVLSGVLKGVGDAVVPVVILGIGTALFRVIWVYTIFKFTMDIQVLSAVYPISWAVTAIAMAVRYKTVKILKTQKSI